MQVNGPFSVNGAKSIQPSNQHSKVDQASETENIFQPNDQVDLSPEATWMMQIGEMPQVRSEKVAEIRAQIESGEYETDEKMEVALDRFLDEMI